MANTQVTFGFRHIGYLGGAAPDYQQNVRLISSANTTAIFTGDPVVKVGSSAYIAAGANNTTTLEGIFVGCEYTPSTGTAGRVWSPYWPGSGAAGDVTAYVISAPSALFLVASLNTAIVTANIGENVGFSTGSGNTTTGISAFTLDQSTLATTNTLPFQVFSLYQGIGNGSDPSTAYNWTVVTFNNQRFKQLTGVA